MHLVYLVIVVCMMSFSCSKKSDPFSVAIGSEPTFKAKRNYGADYVKNIAYSKGSGLTVQEVIERLDKSGILNGGVKSNFSGNPFIINESDLIKEKKIETQESYVFSGEEMALVVYDLKDWIIIEINKW